MKNITKKLVALIIVLALACGGISGEDFSAHANQRPAAKDIPSGTLIIGTHLIAFSALNQELLNVAIRSADESQKAEDPRMIQDKIYYKSELNNGVWYDITSANSIIDITLSSSTAVPNDLIDRLHLTHWTKSNGITIEFATGQRVNLHNINSIKNPANMEELELLMVEKEVQQAKYDALVEADADEDQIDNTKAKIDSLNRISAPIVDSQVNALDSLLDKYADFIQFLINDKRASEQLLLLAHNNIKIIRDTRDLKIFQITLERINRETVVASLLEDGDLLNKYGNAINELHGTITQLTIDLDEGELTKELDKMRAKWRTDLHNSVEAVRYEAGYQILLRLQGIESIYNDRIINRDLELQIIEEARNKVLDILKSGFSEGENADYKAAKARGESAAVLAGMREKILAQQEQRLQELDELEKAHLLRVAFNSSLQIASLENLVNQLSGMLDGLAQDDLTKGAEGLLGDFLDDANRQLAKLKADQARGTGDDRLALDSLRDQADKLQEQYFAAAESGDFAAMMGLKEQLDQLNQEINRQQDQAMEKYRDLLDKKGQLTDKLNKTQDQGERNKLRAELQDTLVQMAQLEPMLDDKARNSLQQLDDLKKELNRALDANDIRAVTGVANNLLRHLDIMPDNLLSDSQKAAEAQGVIDAITVKAEQWAETGNPGAAQNMLALARALEAAGIGGTGDPATPPTQPRHPGYYIVLVDRNIRINQPYLNVDGIIYIPSRIVLESLGARITWKSNRQHVVVQDPAHSLLLEYTINRNIAYLNDRRVVLNKPVESVNGITYIPLRLVLDGYRLQGEIKDGVLYIKK